jgi:glycerol-3-phosphate dehydrogenase
MAEDLIIRNGRVTGVRVRNLRRRTREDLVARNVIVASGGFQSRACHGVQPREGPPARPADK